jgi:glyoxalase family protein
MRGKVQFNVESNHRTLPMHHETVGLHHVTCIAVDPQANLDFYTKVLGLRLVKNTVNFDAPDVYHFYYGDQSASPGTIMTFFPFVYAARGRTGNGVTESTAFAVYEDCLDDWMVRLAQHGVDCSAPYLRMAEHVISFVDPDGLKLELVGVPGESKSSLDILGFSSVSLRVEAPERTVRVLNDILGYRKTMEEAGVQRFTTGSNELGRHVDVMCTPGSMHVQPGGGTVHHIAFRAPSRETLEDWRKEIASVGFNVTPVLDRAYFESIYFREPGGILFEIATDPPGFTVDERLEELGTSLKLPARYEASRADIERRLPPIKLPTNQSSHDRP